MAGSPEGVSKTLSVGTTWGKAEVRSFRDIGCTPEGCKSGTSPAHGRVRHGGALGVV